MAARTWRLVCDMHFCKQACIEGIGKFKKAKAGIELEVLERQSQWYL